MPDSILRITLSRGVGPRGYSPKGSERPNLVMSLHPAQAIDEDRPLQWRVIISSLRVAPNDPLANHKTCNKLHQVLARAEAEDHGADESLLLNTDGNVAEAAGSNLFWVEGRTVCTTPLASGILPGVTRAFVLEICPLLGLASQEKPIKPNALKTADGVFLTTSSLEIVEVVSLDGDLLQRSNVTHEIRHAYRRSVERELAKPNSNRVLTNTVPFYHATLRASRLDDWF